MLRSVNYLVILIVFVSGCATHKVITEPQGADIYKYYEKDTKKENVNLDSFNPKKLEYLGKSPVKLGFNPKLYPFIIQAKMEGYKDSNLLTNTDFPNNIFLISLEEQNHITVKSEPPNSTVLLSSNNKSFRKIGETPIKYFINDENVKMLKFKITKKGYYESKTFDFSNFQASGGNNFVLDIDLISYPIIQISSSPINCDIYQYISVVPKYLN